MIEKYIIGNPINTEAVVVDIEAAKGGLPYWEKDLHSFSYKQKMDKKAVVYGLGETIRGINKRGWTYRSFCSDEPNHLEDKRSLYGAQNFFIIDDGNPVGYFFDTPGSIEFDVGFTDSDMFLIKLEEPDVCVYVIKGEDKRDIVRQFRAIIGESYVPPMWAFGFGQSRWSYRNEKEVREVVDKHKALGIPLDSVYLDIDYMKDYKDFTIDPEAFPDFEKMVSDLRKEGVHLVPIIDAGVKIEEGYDVYEEGVRNNYFCKKENGEDLVAAVWPGRCHFPDFLNEDARRWFGDKYKFLIDKGIDGFWNDMNEPAIFYTEDHLDEVFGEIDKLKGANLDINSFFGFKELVDGVDNNPEDFKRFYHSYNGQKYRHDKVHNLFGFNMTRAAGEAFKRICPDKKILMFSRSSYIGMHRYGGIWTGDNKSWWSHLLLSIKQMPALNMCGFVFSGCDIGGFGADCTRDLLIRWLEAGIFNPLYRNHAADYTRRQETYAFGDTEDFKNIIELRYALIPYIHREFMKAVENNDMYYMPLSFAYDDERSREVEDQLLVGDSLMIAPVYEQNATGRYVYLPERMKMLRFRSVEDFDEEIFEKGDHYVKADLNEFVIFIRPGHSLPLGPAAMNTEAIDYSKIREIRF